MLYKAALISLDDTTRAELERCVRAGTCPQRLVRRAKVILLAADGMPSRQISKQVQLHESHVAMWRQRFLAEGSQCRPRSCGGSSTAWTSSVTRCVAG